MTVQIPAGFVYFEKRPALSCKIEEIRQDFNHNSSLAPGMPLRGRAGACATQAS